MNRLALLVCFLMACSCGQKAPTTHQTPLDDFINECVFDGAFDNAITRNNLADTIDTRLSSMRGDSLSILAGIPMAFESMSEYPQSAFDFQTDHNAGKYVIKFSFAKDFDDCRASLQVLAIVDKDSASELVDGGQYLVQGTFDGIANEFPLPFGKVFSDKTKVANGNGMPYITVATLVVSNPTISPYEEVNHHKDN